jgi:hypothetical protein
MPYAGRQHAPWFKALCLQGYNITLCIHGYNIQYNVRNVSTITAAIMCFCNPGLEGVGNNMHFHYCSWTGSIKPSLQYFHICCIRWLSKFHFHLLKYLKFKKSLNVHYWIGFFLLTISVFVPWWQNRRFDRNALITNTCMNIPNDKVILCHIQIVFYDTD